MTYLTSDVRAQPKLLYLFFSNFLQYHYNSYYRYLVLSNGSLIIRKAILNDIGKYRCSAYNQYLNKTRHFIWSAKVYQLNELTTTTTSLLLPYLQNTIQYVPINGKCTLLCYGVNDLKPIEWWYQRTLNSEMIQLSNSSHEYNIHLANREDHEGYYTCKLSAYNEKQTFSVIVTSIPTVVEPLPSYQSLITAAMTFRCRIYGNPRPTITWYHNGDQINSSFTRYINGNELVIHSFDPDESGIYQCFGRNIAGEAYTAAEMRFKNRGDEELRANPLKNIRCFAHSFNTINITFDSQPNESLFFVHIVQSHPHRWTSLSPIPLNHTSYMVIGDQIPIYRPFQLITRVLFPTSEIRNGKKPKQRTMLSSLRSSAVTCCTQGLLLHLMHLVNDTFVTWSQPDIDGKKYFVLQFAIRHTHPHPENLITQTILGTLGNVELTYKDVTKKLQHIKPLTQAAAQIIMQRAENMYADNEARPPSYLSDVHEDQGDIFNMVFYANVSGILLQHFKRIKLRVLIITKENEHLEQDFRYVQWNSIENNTSEMSNTIFRLTTVESRTLTFNFHDGFNESCVNVCHWQIHFPIFLKEEKICKHKIVVNSLLEVRNLKPSERYRLDFLSCESSIPYGQLDVKTLPDPPGTISNHSVIRHEGLKLIWSPPKQQNGKIHHYNILWTLGNVTHEANVKECQLCFYKVKKQKKKKNFPNISESSKINVTIRVVGETGVGAPIFVDLRDINHHALDVELSSNDADIYSGIAIGSLLSTCCICCFALLIIFQRRRFKARQETPTHLTTPSEVNFSSMNNTSLPSGSAGALSGGSTTVQQDYYEMQNLIPKTRRQNELVTAATSPEFQVTHLLNGTNVLTKTKTICGIETEELENNSSNAFNNNNNNNNNINNHHRKLNDRKPFFISLKHLPAHSTINTKLNITSGILLTAADGINNQHQQQNSLPNSSSIMPLATLLNNNTNNIVPCHVNVKNGLSKNNKSSCSLSSTTNSNSKRAFSTNYPKHSNSYDGICLLVEEESVSTPTTEASESTMECGYKPLIERTKVAQSTTSDKGSAQHIKTKHCFNAADGKNRRPVIDPNG